MCHCIFFRINPHVSKHHAFCLHRATWWQLRLSSREDICVSLCQLLVECWRGRSLSDSQQSYNSEVVFMREQVCSSEEVHCGSARSTAGDVGTSDTRTTPRLYHSIKREHIDHVSGSWRISTLAHCVGWSLAGKAQSAASSSRNRLNAQNSVN